MWIMGVEKLKLKTLSTFVYTECFRLCRKAYFAIAVYLNCSVPSRPVWRAANAVWAKPAPPPTVACVTVIIVTDNTQEKVPNMLYMRELCIPQNSWNNQYRMGSFILNKILFINNFSFSLWKESHTGTNISVFTKVHMESGLIAVHILATEPPSLVLYVSEA